MGWIGWIRVFVVFIHVCQNPFVRFCRRCGSWWHAQSVCPHRQSRCGKCGALGHLEEWCRTRGRRLRTKKKGEKDEEARLFYQTCAVYYIYKYIILYVQSSQHPLFALQSVLDPHVLKLTIHHRKTRRKTGKRSWKRRWIRWMRKNWRRFWRVVPVVATPSTKPRTGARSSRAGGSSTILTH